ALHPLPRLRRHLEDPHPWPDALDVPPGGARVELRGRRQVRLGHPHESRATSPRRGWDSDGSGVPNAGKNIKYAINSTDYTPGNFNNVSLSSSHPGGVNVALCDGSVRFLRETTPLSTLLGLASRNGGEVVTVD